MKSKRRIFNLTENGSTSSPREAFIHVKMPTTQRYTPEDVLDLTEPTSTFLCSLAANTYRIEFNHFQIKDYVSKQKIFEIYINPNEYYDC